MKGPAIAPKPHLRLAENHIHTESASKRYSLETGRFFNKSGSPLSPPSSIIVG